MSARAGSGSAAGPDSHSGRPELRHKGAVSAVSRGSVGTRLETLYQLSQGFVGAGGSPVKVLPMDVGGDATSGPRLINLTQLSPCPGGAQTLSEDERLGRVYVLEEGKVSRKPVKGACCPHIIALILINVS